MAFWNNYSLPVYRLTPGDGEYFFGYYDLEATDDKYHLCHKAPFINRLHTAGDKVQVGTIPLYGGEFTPFDETEAWCFQQGSMLQFVQGKKRTVIYNIEKDDHYGSRIRDLDTGETKDFDRPVSALSPDGKFFLSVNMSRLYDFRPGYGYAGIVDPFMDVPAPQYDGVWSVDIETGEEKLLVSVSELAELAGDYYNKNAKLCINHITVAPDAKRYVMLVRNMDCYPFNTLVLTADCGGAGSPFILLNDKYASHYWWHNANELICYCSYSGERGTYTLYDKTKKSKMWDPEYFSFDGHMRVSPDGKWLSYDSYPDKNRNRHLLLYGIEDGIGYEFARLYEPDLGNVDIRCDMHPRWSYDGKMLTFDSIHEGTREIYAVRAADFPEIKADKR